MTATLRFRIQEWFAERFRWAQFPRQRLLVRAAAPPIFAHAMPWWARLGIASIGLALIVLAGAALFFLGLLGYAALAG